MHAPDLYIPMMAFVTYILIIGFSEGIGENFNPDNIGRTAFKCFLISFIEVLFIGTYFYIKKIQIATL